MEKVKEMIVSSKEDILKYAESLGIERPHFDECNTVLMTGWFNVYGVLSGVTVKLYGHWKETILKSQILGSKPAVSYIFGVYEPEVL